MKVLFYFILIGLSFESIYAQNIKGEILSDADRLGIEGSHILNISNNRLAISSELGYFSIKGDLGDTLVVSNINYITKQFIINTRNQISVILEPNMVQLDEVIVSNLPVKEADFRKKLIEMPMQDNGKMVPFGVTPGKPMPSIPVIYDKRAISGLGYAITNPVRYTVSKFNGKFKEKVKYWAIQADLDNSIIRNKKYNRELVGSLTELQGDELTNFINYIDLNDSYIETSSEYEIAERIREEFEEYKLLNQEK